MANLTNIDRQIERLKQIKSLLSDPEAVQLIREALSEDGAPKHGRHDRAGHADNGLSIELPDQQERGSKTRIIRAVIARQPNRFDVRIIGESVRKLGVNMDNAAVAKTLQWLEKKNEIRVVKRGTPGGNPTVYERTEHFSTG